MPYGLLERVLVDRLPNTCGLIFDGIEDTHGHSCSNDEEGE